MTYTRWEGPDCQATWGSIFQAHKATPGGAGPRTAPRAASPPPKSSLCDLHPSPPLQPPSGLTTYMSTPGIASRVTHSTLAAPALPAGGQQPIPTIPSRDPLLDPLAPPARSPVPERLQAKAPSTSPGSRGPSVILSSSALTRARLHVGQHDCHHATALLRNAPRPHSACSGEPASLWKALQVWSAPPPRVSSLCSLHLPFRGGHTSGPCSPTCRAHQPSCPRTIGAPGST